jgi:hypothetical protein
MPSFAKTPHLQGLPVQNQIRPHSATSTLYGGAVIGRVILPQMNQHPAPRPAQNVRVVALFANSRGVPGQGCRCAVRNGVRQPEDTIVFTGLLPGRGDRLITKSTNCHCAADGHPRGAIPAAGNLPAPPPPPAPPAPVASVQAVAYPALDQIVGLPPPPGPSNHPRNSSGASACSRCASIPHSPQHRAIPAHHRKYPGKNVEVTSQPSATSLPSQQRPPVGQRKPEQVPFDKHSFKAPLPATFKKLEGSNFHEAVKEHTFRALNCSERALRHAQQVGLDKAVDDLAEERKYFFDRFYGSKVPKTG